MWRRIQLFLEMIRFSHTLFALPFALMSALLAWYTKAQGFQAIELVGIFLCMVFARSAAMAFNRLADRDIDARNPRTAQRHLPAGLLSPAIVWAFTLLCSLGFFLSTLLFLWADPPNPWPLWLCIPVLVFIFTYSYTKRFTWMVHFWLGASLFLAPLAAWISIQGLEALAIPLTLGGAVFFWVAGFDILYACQDAEFDQQAGLRSIPSRWGIPMALRIALGCHIGMIVFLLVLSKIGGPHLGLIYLAGVAGVAILLLYEHYLVSPKDLTQVNKAFFQVNAVVSLGLLAIVALQLWANTFKAQ